MLLRRGAALAELRTLLAAHGASVQLMHPGVADDALARWYMIDAGTSVRLASLIQALQAHPAVDAAYVKPSGEVPH